MKKDSYSNMMQKIKSHAKYVTFIQKGNKICTGAVYVVFLLFLSWLLINKDERIIRILLTTAISFFLVSIFRKVVNRKRPYEKFGVQSVIEKDKKGNSFPSRHVFSAFVIAMSVFYVNIWLGIVMFALAFAIAVLRVVGGVHYISDVLAGAAVGIISGFLGFFI